MKYRLFVISLLFLVRVSFATESKINPCVVPESAIGIGMIEAMDQDMRINIQTLQKDKTKVTLLSNIAVSERLAEQFAITDEKNLLTAGFP